MRTFCQECHRPAVTCFCASARPFASSPEVALIVHPMEVKSTVGTAWILRRSISNLRWLGSNGLQLDQNARLHAWLQIPDRVPILLYPGADALPLNRAETATWQALIPPGKQPLLIVLDGTWSQAKAMLKRSALLRSLPRVSFDAAGLSEYGFKRQPAAECLSSVESVHRVLEILDQRGWGQLPASREHDQMLTVFRAMVRRQLAITA